jgi:hypothetical protein
MQMMLDNKVWRKTQEKRINMLKYGKNSRTKSAQMR